eukprot:g1103.t1
MIREPSKTIAFLKKNRDEEYSSSVLDSPTTPTRRGGRGNSGTSPTTPTRHGVRGKAQDGKGVLKTPETRRRISTMTTPSPARSPKDVSLPRGSERARELDYSDSNLDRVSNLSACVDTLESLDLARNNLRSFPKVCARMRRLRTLDLSGNHIRRLPPFLSQMETLTRLSVAGNRLFDLEETVRHLPRRIAILSLKGNIWERPGGKESSSAAAALGIFAGYSPATKKRAKMRRSMTMSKREFRRYVLIRVPSLKQLDGEDTAVEIRRLGRDIGTYRRQQDIEQQRRRQRNRDVSEFRNDDEGDVKIVSATSLQSPGRRRRSPVRSRKESSEARRRVASPEITHTEVAGHNDEEISDSVAVALSALEVGEENENRDSDDVRDSNEIFERETNPSQVVLKRTLRPDASSFAFFGAAKLRNSNDATHARDAKNERFESTDDGDESAPTDESLVDPRPRPQYLTSNTLEWQEREREGRKEEEGGGRGEDPFHMTKTRAPTVVPRRADECWRSTDELEYLHRRSDDGNRRSSLPGRETRKEESNDIIRGVLQKCLRRVDAARRRVHRLEANPSAPHVALEDARGSLAKEMAELERVEDAMLNPSDVGPARNDERTTRGGLGVVDLGTSLVRNKPIATSEDENGDDEDRHNVETVGLRSVRRPARHRTSPSPPSYDRETSSGDDPLVRDAVVELEDATARLARLRSERDERLKCLRRRRSSPRRGRPRSSPSPHLAVSQRTSVLSTSFLKRDDDDEEALLAGDATTLKTTSDRRQQRRSSSPSFRSARPRPSSLEDISAILGPSVDDNDYFEDDDDAELRRDAAIAARRIAFADEEAKEVKRRFRKEMHKIAEKLEQQRDRHGRQTWRGSGHSSSSQRSRSVGGIRRPPVRDRAFFRWADALKHFDHEDSGYLPFALFRRVLREIAPPMLTDGEMECLAVCFGYDARELIVDWRKFAEYMRSHRVSRAESVRQREEARQAVVEFFNEIVDEEETTTTAAAKRRGSSIFKSPWPRYLRNRAEWKARARKQRVMRQEEMSLRPSPQRASSSPRLSGGGV